MACMTVLGEVDIKKLGIVTPHEHIFIDMSVFFSEPEEISSKLIAHAPVTIDKLGILKRNNFAMLDNVQMMDYETQKKEIMEFKYAGGRTVVDASNHGLGRDPTLLKRIAIDTGLNIICGCGYYVASAQDDQTLQLTVEEMEADIVREQKEQNVPDDEIWIDRTIAMLMAKWKIKWNKLTEVQQRSFKEVLMQSELRKEQLPKKRMRGRKR
mgnify:CR=1 FL=1